MITYHSRDPWMRIHLDAGVEGNAYIYVGREDVEISWDKDEDGLLYAIIKLPAKPLMTLARRQAIDDIVSVIENMD